MALKPEREVTRPAAPAAARPPPGERALPRPPDVQRAVRPWPVAPGFRSQPPAAQPGPSPNRACDATSATGTAPCPCSRGVSLRALERRRAAAFLLRLGLVVLLDVLGEPGNPLDRH